VTIHYDPMISKIISHGVNRAEAIDKMTKALDETVLFGPNNNLDFLRSIVRHPVFRSGKITTGFIPEHFPSFRRTSSPDTVELARASASVLTYLGGKQISGSELNLAQTGGDLLPWIQIEGFRLWN
ncbi:MAG TPA: hypothetical protein PLW55_17145, partial [Leptospiraceae bacterium]|nr:hypothetical protein [Leptospiraceae bacterium]